MSVDAIAESTTDLPPSHRPCLNCGDEAEGNYCRTCGQRKIEHRASVRTMVRNMLEDQFSVTTELPRTLSALFRRPGLLTTEYSAGRIARYIPPLRLYLMASVLFFLVLSLRTSGAPLASPTALPKVDSASQAARDSIGKVAAAKLRATPDSLLSANQVCLKNSTTRTKFCSPFRWLNKLVAPRLPYLDQIPRGQMMPRLKEFVIRRTPTMMFVLLPLFALILAALYWRSRRFYAEHFVFALHIHTFLFIALSFIVGPLHYIAVKFGSGGKPIGDFEFVVLALFMYMGIYTLLALKRVYRQGWFKTAFKLALMAGVYSILLIVALMTEVVAAMLYM